MTRDTVIFPGTLAEALVSEMVQPGHRLLLREGVYSGDFYSTIAGGAENPIVIMAFPGERAIINGKFGIHGGHVTIQDLEFTATYTERETDQPGSPPDFPVLGGIQVCSAGVRLINNIIHDCRNDAIESGSSVPGTYIYGNIIFNCGWSGPDRGHGHGVYTQNPISGGLRQIIQNNIFVDGFCLGIKVYIQSPWPIGNYKISQNICSGANVLYLVEGEQGEGWNIYAGQYGGDSQYLSDLEFTENCTYMRRQIHLDQNLLGLQDGALNVRLINNYWQEGFRNVNAEIVEDTGNHFGFVGAPAGDCSFVFPNEYQDGCAHIAIYNEARLDAVSVDIAGILQPGQSYQLHNVQDYFNDIFEGVVSPDGLVSISMINHTVRVPEAWIATESTFPEFGVFVLRG